ncbi:ABC transporter permease [Virgibacillus phasianinus]|uniref:ABC transporter permease n=1 Tax=Virgibacillus phasianinus TaxID=2017483 RepID=A0A220TZS1_9BACI|nr:ABC transporter permease [Virgibacillus phasianinus]ASK61282.1 ABC transporter permease [Virgibacillus phasianinus]
MSNFFQLLVNEQIKTYIKKSTWAMYIILALIIIGIGFMTNFFEGTTTPKYDEDTWRQTLQDENKQIKKDMQEMSKNEAEMMGDYNNSQLEKNNFYLENDIMPANYDAWQFVLDNKTLLSLITLFTIIVAAGIIANEFKWGTIKLLLIRPISRTKILLSKYISVLLFALWTLLFVLILSFLVGAIFFGINSFDPQIVTDQKGSFEQVSVINQIFAAYGFQLVTLLMMATFAFMISAIFRQSSLAIGLAIFLMFAGTSIVGFFADHEWAKYILFANTNLEQYVNGTPMIEGMTLGFSIGVLIVYFIIFSVITWLFFTKRDVAGH